VTKDAVPEGPSDERSEERSADAVLNDGSAPQSSEALQGQNIAHVIDRFCFFFSMYSSIWSLKFTIEICPSNMISLFFFIQWL
jgi:hypothetical protein